MALIEFKNLPDTNTPITAENLNHNFNTLAERNIMTIGLSADMTYSRNDTGKTSNLIPLNKLMSSTGDKLTFDTANNAIKIGAGVSKVKVSANAIQSATEAGLCGINISKNAPNNQTTLTEIVNVGFSYVQVTGQMIKLSLSPIEVSVSEGDVIHLFGYTDVNSNVVTMVSYAGRGTNLTVEVVE